jgi:hypothetical protein
MQGLTKTIELRGQEVTARELTTLEVRNWLSSQRDAAEFDVVDNFLFAEEGVSTADLRLMSDVSAELLDSLTPSEILPLAQAIKEVNPNFFEMRRRLIAIGSTPA